MEVEEEEEEEEEEEAEEEAEAEEAEEHFPRHAGVCVLIRTATRFCNFHSPAPRGVAGGAEWGVRENRESVCKL